ncbi:MAG: hypothetical protein PHG47_04680 [Sulfuricella sp.]|nr:hypothetical protein [Sulfuricella sp.]
MNYPEIKFPRFTGGIGSACSGSGRSSCCRVYVDYTQIHLGTEGTALKQIMAKAVLKRHEV